MDENAQIAWEGDSLQVLRTFPKGIREDLGAELYRLQVGEKPINSRPMKSIGARVFELKERDAAGWYRVIYLAKVGNTVHVLHSFKKKSAKTSKNDLAVAERRLKAVQKRLREAKDGENKDRK